MNLIRKIALVALLYLNLAITQVWALSTAKVDHNFTQQDITQTINEIITVLERDYIFPEKVTLIANELTHKLASNGFNQVNGLDKFINELGILLRNVSEDGHIDIIKSNAQIVIAHTQADDMHENNQDFGFEKIEILAGNIGYLKLNYFYQNPMAELRAAKAFDYLSATDAIIIDLRDVAGESISLAQYMMSFFVEYETILSQVVYERQTKTQVITAVENIANMRFKNAFPVYILTSAFVSGTGEFFSYTLKHLNKAVIIGEQTMGVAYITSTLAVNEFISIKMPIAIPIHPLTNTNWQSNGVVPDFTVDSEISFEFAYKLAKQYLRVF